MIKVGGSNSFAMDAKRIYSLAWGAGEFQVVLLSLSFDFFQVI